MFHDLNPKKQSYLCLTMNFENETYYNLQDMIDKLNNFFSTVGGISANTDFSSLTFEKVENFVQSKVPPNVEFKIPLIKLDETKSFLNKLEASKATGSDNLGPYFLKLSSEIVAPCVTYLINLSILQGVFPSNIKIAKVIPLFNSGDKSLPENYRPISVLPCFSKIVEKHVASHLYLYLSKYKLLHESQSGFRSQYSCHTALTHLIDKWLKCMND